IPASDESRGPLVRGRCSGWVGPGFCRDDGLFLRVLCVSVVKLFLQGAGESPGEVGERRVGGGGRGDRQDVAAAKVVADPIAKLAADMPAAKSIVPTALPFFAIVKVALAVAAVPHAP